MPLDYRGTQRNGRSAVGAMPRTTRALDEFIRQTWRVGWSQLEIYDGEVQVAGIGESDEGRWWWSGEARGTVEP